MKGIMIQGTQSDAGKSYVVTGLARLFANKGYKISPFKSQNMSNNSYVVGDGLEIGRAQGAQSEAAKQVANVYMNPILLKPSTDQSSEVVLFGEVYKKYSGYEYRDDFTMTKGVESIQKALGYIKEHYDAVIIEGAGSPAEVNLNDREIVNMRVAELADVDVLLVTNIDLGGSFASLVGTLELVAEHRHRIKGVIFNKFRGDVRLLEDGLTWFEEYTGVKVVGVIPYNRDIYVETEDAQSEIFLPKNNALDIGVIHMERVSNNTDVEPFIHEEDVSLRLIKTAKDFGTPDAIIIPGTKATISDLAKLREKGLADAISEFAKTNKPIMGICGGYQVLGKEIMDPLSMDDPMHSKIDGIGLLDVTTVFETSKNVRNISGVTKTGKEISGYEIHLGHSDSKEIPFAVLEDGTLDGATNGNIDATYLHNIFHNDAFRTEWLNRVRKLKGLLEREIVDTSLVKEESFDKLAKVIEDHLDIEFIEELMFK